MMKKQLSALGIIGALMFSGVASGTILSGQMTVDNAFNFYITTNDSTIGILVSSGNVWASAYSFSTSVTPGVTNYIHVVGNDYGVIAGFIGGFSLNDTSFHFANGTQNLLTNTTDWKVSTIGFGTGYVTPLNQGQNGVSPWGLNSGIPGSSAWIWEPNNCTNCTAYFSASIAPALAVPEPEEYMMMLLGFGMVGYQIKRKQKKSAPAAA